MSALAHLTEEDKAPGKYVVVLNPLQPSEYEFGTVAFVRKWLIKQAIEPHTPLVWEDGRATVKELLDVFVDADDDCFLGSENGALYVGTSPVQALGPGVFSFGQKLDPKVLSYYATLSSQRRP